jgi:hypothetical protein
MVIDTPLTHIAIQILKVVNISCTMFQNGQGLIGLFGIKICHFWIDSNRRKILYFLWSAEL